MKPEDNEELLKAFADWDGEEKEIWVDEFAAIRTLLMEARIESAGDRWLLTEEEKKLEILSLDVQTAAKLADESMREIELRFHIQEEKTAVRHSKEREKFRQRRQAQQRQTKKPR